MLKTIIIFFVALLLGILLTKLLIPVLRRMKMGQTILADGPSWHNTKSGTPTMGGLVFLPVACLSLLGGVSLDKVYVLLCGLLFCLIGALDDGIKILKKRNMGLTSKQKFSMQVIASCLLALILRFPMGIHAVWIPVVGSVSLGNLFIPFVILFFLAMTNSINLTDGIDGLATSTCFINAVFLAIVAFIMRDYRDIGQTMIALCGVLLAFFIFNSHPAKVFMGDTGALCLGGLLAGAAVVMGLEFAFVVTGIWFLIETASVIIQTTHFRITGKRFFKMSPFHHHLELCMWKETKIVLFASIVTALACGIMLILLKY
ncbi:MAG: phospho-N-acetylmuramoyl-pentapeptide-transferase [Clostridia bacterium]|nr:phospho-N-acetylmuramoyl-pentapeptide-transferase [Clostridia bacterium]